MTHHPKILVQTLLRRSCLQPSDLFKRLLRFDKMLPELRPSVCNWTDPLNKPWDMAHLERLLPNDFGVGNAGTVYWKRRSRPKAEGLFGVARHNGSGNGNDQHSNSRFTVSLGEIDVGHLVDYLIEDAREDADIAQVHVMAEQERVRREIELSYSGELDEYSTFVLKHWLPELPWAVVFGEAYVRLFSMERLMTAPAYKVQQLSDQTVFIQLSPRLSDFIENYDAVDAVRQRVKDHIGRDVFFDVSKAYPLRLMGEMPADQWVKLHAEFRQLPPGSTGIRVPEFRYIEDDEQTRANHPKATCQTVESFDAKYDDASWHYGGDFPEYLPPEAGMMHMAIFWCWAMLAGLGKGSNLREEIQQKMNSNSDSPRICFERHNSEKFTDADLTEIGKKFTEAYYPGDYIDDYVKTFDEAPTFYEVEDTWDSVTRISSLLELRLREWKSHHP